MKKRLKISKVFLTELSASIRAAILPALLSCAVFGFLAYSILDRIQTIQRVIFADDADFHIETIYWFMTGKDAVALPGISSILGAIAAVCMLYFLFSKGRARMTLLVGVTRSKLLLIRSATGVLSVTLPLILAFTAIAIGNAVKFGGSPWLTEAAIYFVFTLSAMMLLGFSLTVLVILISGKVREFVFCEAVVFGAPHLIAGLINSLGAKGIYAISEISKIELSSSSVIYPTVSPFTSFIFSLAKYSNCEFYTNGGGLSYNGYEQQTIEYPLVIFYFFISIAIIAASCFIFKRKSAEYISSHRQMLIKETIIAALLATVPARLFASTEVLYYVFFAATTFLVLILYSGRERIKKKLIVTGICTALLLTVTLTLSLGYSKYLPDEDDVECVYINYNPAITPGSYVSQGDIYSAVTTYNIVTDPHKYMEGAYGVLSSAEEIKLALKLHRLLIADGNLNYTGEVSDTVSDTAVNVDLKISYGLKNGSTVTRAFPYVKLSTLEKFLELDTSNARKKQLKDMYTYTLKGYDITLSDNMIANKTLLSLDNDKRAELIDAIISDKASESIEDRYFPKEDCLGMLRFSQTTRSVCEVYIYEKDTAILSFLRENELYSALEKSYEITGASIYSVPLFIDDSSYGFTMVAKAVENPRTNFSKEAHVNGIARHDYEALAEAARPTYFVKDGGYYVIFNILNEDRETKRVGKFIPFER